MAKRHYIPVTADVPGAASEGNCALIRKVIRTALAAEGVDVPCEVDVLLTDVYKRQGDQIFPVEVCCRLGADGVAPHQPQHQRSTASTGDPEQRLHQPRQPGGGQLPEPQSQQR